MNSRVLITGATGGFGRALCWACAARGWDLFLTDIAADALQALTDELTATHRVAVSAWPCDLTSANDRTALWEHITTDRPRFWMVINVAGLDHQGPFGEQSVSDLAELVRLHVEAPIEMCRRALNHRDEQRTLHLVNVASLAAFFPMPGKAVYAATKSCLLNLSRALHHELAGQSVCVTVVCPAGMPTAPRSINGIAAQGLWGRLTASSVGTTAEQTLDAALAGKAIYIPRRVNRVIRALSRLMPTSWQIRWIARRWDRRNGPAEDRAII